MGFGDNTKAALMTRGLTETARLAWPWAAAEKPLRDCPAWVT